MATKKKDPAESGNLKECDDKVKECVKKYLLDGRSKMVNALVDEGVYFEPTSTNEELAELCYENFGEQYPVTLKSFDELV